jgi:hypothetical protein
MKKGVRKRKKKKQDGKGRDQGIINNNKTQ